MSGEDRVQATADRLRQAAEKAGMVVTADGRISESDSEILTGYGRGTFRGLREVGVGPAWYRAAVASARISYRIDDLAAWLEGRRTESVL